MAEYEQRYFRFRGSSRIDTIPSPVGRAGYTRYDVDTKREFYSDGTNWLLMRKEIAGGYYADSQGGVDAFGCLNGLVGIGNQGTNTTNTAGKYHIWNTRNVTNDCAGVLKLDDYVELRSRSPIYSFKFLWVANGSSNRRMFKGLGPKRLINVNTDTTPVNSNEFCFFFGHGAADTQWQIWNNDATGTCVKTSTGINIPAINTNYILEILADNTLGYVWSLYNVTSNERGALVSGATGIVNTRIPATTTSTYLQDLIITSDGSIQPNNIHNIEVYIN